MEESLSLKLPLEIVSKCKLISLSKNNQNLQSNVEVLRLKKETLGVEQITNELEMQIEEDKLHLLKLKKFYDNLLTQLNSLESSNYLKNKSLELENKRFKLESVRKKLEDLRKTTPFFIDLPQLEQIALQNQELRKQLHTLEAQIACYEEIPPSSLDALVAVEKIKNEIDKIKVERENSVYASVDDFISWKAKK